MLMLVNCSNCHTPLQLPPGAASIRCAICQAITRIADPRAAPPAPPHPITPPLPLLSMGTTTTTLLRRSRLRRRTTTRRQVRLHRHMGGRRR
ncbi:UNVERIFIED_CONTAM: Metacaspase-1 [Sesamum latifolium]|uniref:Metacaspase-1 n=1 Tax=Sesamum latifolium TaxID=2727402 RepID=A0AAW2T8N6_9LAMI